MPLQIKEKCWHIIAFGIGEPSLYHALIVIFLEFFSWGLLTVPVIKVISETFPSNKFLMNGLILGVKGILSFLSAPMIGALSDIWGRKFFLLLTVFCTCMPIPWLSINPWWYFALFSISGLFSVTFSVVLAYVADITEKEDRSAAIGLVSATFGASLVTSPALGAWISDAWGDNAVVALATAVAVADVFFIMAAVPESLSPKLRHSWSAIEWQKTDPFQTLRMVGEDKTVLLLCTVVFLSYLPEAGQFSCFFVYLKLVIGFSPEAVASFIGLVGILSMFAQTCLLLALHGSFGAKITITVGLVLQTIQLTWYGLATQIWMMWAAGVLAAMSQITYPSVSAYVSVHTDENKQGTVQGIINGVRGLCAGLGPALFGLIFYLFHVDLNVADGDGDRIGMPLVGGVPNVILNKFGGKSGPAQNYIRGAIGNNVTETATIHKQLGDPGDSYSDFSQRLVPGPPFLVGAVLVTLALFVISKLPDNPTSKLFPGTRRSKSTSGGNSPLLPRGSDEAKEESSLLRNEEDRSGMMIDGKPVTGDRWNGRKNSANDPSDDSAGSNHNNNKQLFGSRVSKKLEDNHPRQNEKWIKDTLSLSSSIRTNSPVAEQRKKSTKLPTPKHGSREKMEKSKNVRRYFRDKVDYYTEKSKLRSSVALPAVVGSPPRSVVENKASFIPVIVKKPTIMRQTRTTKLSKRVNSDSDVVKVHFNGSIYEKNEDCLQL